MDKEQRVAEGGLERKEFNGGCLLIDEERERLNSMYSEERKLFWFMTAYAAMLPVVVYGLSIVASRLGENSSSEDVLRLIGGLAVLAISVIGAWDKHERWEANERQIRILLGTERIEEMPTGT
ncbi:MAG: hypothetical protein UY21_C0003G0002 [Microgenomates group bacterium GW2011_GWA1_48_10]|nr:MAG: hypothetical protein UY21_C0003G0002 [Microgenomates group bacterium GW2011_GWA1_48_10]